MVLLAIAMSGNNLHSKNRVIRELIVSVETK